MERNRVPSLLLRLSRLRKKDLISRLQTSGFFELLPYALPETAKLREFLREKENRLKSAIALFSRISHKLCILSQTAALRHFIEERSLERSSQPAISTAGF